MWFGDLVTVRWWDDLWLNESFAEYVSTLATAETTRWTSAWTTFSSMEKSWAYKQDQLPSTHPIVADIRDLEDVEVNFDGITYAKGASVLKQLVSWVGQEEFFAGVRAYFARHAWGNTELRDLLVELERTSGRDLQAWSALWLERAGVTLLRPHMETDAHDIITAFEVLQEVPAEHPVQRPHRLAVSGYDVVAGPDGKARLDRVVRAELDINGARTSVPEMLGRSRPSLVLVNDDDLAYAKVRLDADSLTVATEHLHAFTDSLPRTLVWGAAWDMTRDGEWAARRFIDLVLGNIAHETDSSVVLVLLRQLTTAIDLYIAPERRATTSGAAADRLRELAGAAPAGSDAQLQLVKAYAARAATTAQLDAVSGFLEETAPLAGLSVDTDLRWDLLIALVAGGRAGDAQIGAELERDAKAAAWAAVVESDSLSNTLKTSTIAGFGGVHDVALLEPLVEPYFEALERVWTSRTNEMAQNIVVGLYPTLLTGTGVDLLARTDAWLGELGDRHPALRRLVVENRDGVRRARPARHPSGPAG